MWCTVRVKVDASECEGTNERTSDRVTDNEGSGDLWFRDGVSRFHGPKDIPYTLDISGELSQWMGY